MVFCKASSLSRNIEFSDICSWANQYMLLLLLLLLVLVVLLRVLELLALLVLLLLLLLLLPLPLLLLLFLPLPDPANITSMHEKMIAAAETAQTNGHADDDGDEELGPAMKPHHNI